MLANKQDCLLVYQLKSIHMWITQRHEPVYKFCLKIVDALSSRAAVTSWFWNPSKHGSRSRSDMQWLFASWTVPKGKKGYCVTSTWRINDRRLF